MNKVKPSQAAYAAGLFEKGGHWALSASAWSKSGGEGRYRALEACRNGKEWDMALEFIQEWMTLMSEEGHLRRDGSSSASASSRPLPAAAGGTEYPPSSLFMSRPWLLEKLSFFAKRAAQSCLKKEGGGERDEERAMEYVNLLPERGSRLNFLRRWVGSLQGRYAWIREGRCNV